MQYLLYILSIPFIYLNYKILISDIKNKIIPNKYLIYLLYIIPIYYIYIFFTFPDINYLVLLSQVIITFVISFILYYFWIWAAWDAKYLLVLSLFIPNLWIIPLLWNISLLIIVYLLFYFIWFYLWKLTFNAEYRKSLILNVKQDLKEKWFNYKEKKWWKTFIIILKWLIVFLLIFVSIRLSRTYLFNTFFENWNNFIIVQDIINKRNIYLLFLIIWILFLFIYLIRNLISKIKEYINKKTSINLNILSNLFIFILSLSLLWFILKEYLIEPEKISKLLFLIFTLYLALRIFFKILFYSYKITFWIAELTYIDIWKLKEWDLIDKPYLIKIFW